MDREGTTHDFWSMRPKQLAEECRELGEASGPGFDAKIRTEARELAAEWQEALSLPRNDAFSESRRSELIGGLRRRTIEILVKVRGI